MTRTGPRSWTCSQPPTGSSAPPAPRVGQRVIDIPPNMTTAERVRWIAARVTKLGLTRDAPVAS